jgi:probable addiction module antidote protein
MENVKKTKKTKNASRSIPYNEWLIEKLKDHQLAVEYLNDALKESMEGDPESLELLLMALKNVIYAQGGVAKIAKKAGLGRESLYKTVSEKGNPEFKTIAALTHALGLELTFRSSRGN